MKVLIVCSGNFGYIKPFVSEQVETLNEMGVQTEYFLIEGKGITGYLKNLNPYRKKVKTENFDLVHAHFGLSGLLANMQRKVPVIISFLTGEQLFWHINILSSIASTLSRKNIFVSESTYKDLFIKIPSKKIVIPLGVQTNIFKPVSGGIAKNEMKIPNGKINILFASDFTKEKFYKNPKLAFNAISGIENVNFIELKNYSRNQVNLLLNAVDLLLLTSKVEGSPMIIKEAMACNCPIVATDVGDIKEVIADTENCYITGFDPKEISQRISQVIENNQRTNGRKRIEQFYDNKIIARKVLEVYRSLL